MKLYDVSQVMVEANVHLDHLETEDQHTRLHIINSSQSTNHDFTLRGFSQENILFITDRPHHNHQQVSEFQSLLQQIGDWVRSESQEMSLWLSISVFLLRYFHNYIMKYLVHQLCFSIGIGTMIISLIKRHRLALEAVVYNSIGSLKRLKRKSSVPRSGGVKETKAPGDITTATEVAFFPRYSVVNKSWRGEKQQPRSDRAENTEKPEMKKKEKSRNKSVGKVDKPPVTVTEEMNKNTPSRQISKSSLYEIISTMKMKSSAKAEPRQAEEKKPSPLETSFYHYHSQGGNVSSASSKYDLTMARSKKNNVQVQVHQPNYVTLKAHKVVNLEVENEPKSSSPQPLLNDSAEKIYSFNSLREKCRKMIANSKPFQSKTKL